MNSKPQIAKTLMLPKVLEQMTRTIMKEPLLDAGILAALREWLKPSSDGSLPAMDIRTNLLDVLDVFVDNVSGDSLVESGLGTAVLALAKHPHENTKNKTNAGKLAIKWARKAKGDTAENAEVWVVMVVMTSSIGG